MANSAEARTEILRRIRAATGNPAEATVIEAEWNAIQRDYKLVTSVDHEGLLEQLEDRLRDYDAGVYRCHPAEIPALVGKILAERGK
jgi:L-lactate dehydrogenase complex protein LldG